MKVAANVRLLIFGLGQPKMHFSQQTASMFPSYKLAIGLAGLELAMRRQIVRIITKYGSRERFPQLNAAFELGSNRTKA